MKRRLSQLWRASLICSEIGWFGGSMLKCLQTGCHAGSFTVTVWKKIRKGRGKYLCQFFKMQTETERDWYTRRDELISLYPGIALCSQNPLPERQFPFL